MVWVSARRATERVSRGGAPVVALSTFWARVVFLTAGPPCYRRAGLTVNNNTSFLSLKHLESRQYLEERILGMLLNRPSACGKQFGRGPEPTRSPTLGKSIWGMVLNLTVLAAKLVAVSWCSLGALWFAECRGRGGRRAGPGGPSGPSGRRRH